MLDVVRGQLREVSMKTIVAMLAVCFALATPRGARADDGEEAKKQEALVLLKEGNKAAQEGDHALALEKFEQAYEKYASPNLLINIGTTLAHLGRHAEAADTYERFLADPKAEASKKAAVQSQLALLEQRIARIRVELSEPGARLTLDGGRSVGGGGVREIVRVDPGSHTLVATKEGFREASATVSVKAGQVEIVEMRLERIEKPREREPAPDAADAGLDSGAGDDAAVIEKAAPAARGGIGGVVRVAVDVGGPDAAAVVGGAYGIGNRLCLHLAAILGGNQGVYADGVLSLTTGRLRPTLTLGVPVFFIDGARPAVRAAGGIAWELTSSVELTLDLGVEYFLSIPDDYEKTLFVPSMGVQARL